MTRTTFAPQPLPIVIGRTLDALGFRMVIDTIGCRHLYWPHLFEDVAPTVLPGAYPDIAPDNDSERRGAHMALVNIVRHMSQADVEAMFSAFADSETIDTFDFRKQMSL
jgi:hypothetical protein